MQEKGGATEHTRCRGPVVLLYTGVTALFRSLSYGQPKPSVCMHAPFRSQYDHLRLKNMYQVTPDLMLTKKRATVGRYRLIAPNVFWGLITIGALCLFEKYGKRKPGTQSHRLPRPVREEHVGSKVQSAVSGDYPLVYPRVCYN